jgi:hypothetical protein
MALDLVTILRGPSRRWRLASSGQWHHVPLVSGVLPLVEYCSDPGTHPPTCAGLRGYRSDDMRVGGPVPIRGRTPTAGGGWWMGFLTRPTAQFWAAARTRRASARPSPWRR